MLSGSGGVCLMDRLSISEEWLLVFIPKYTIERGEGVFVDGWPDLSEDRSFFFARFTQGQVQQK